MNKNTNNEKIQWLKGIVDICLQSLIEQDFVSRQQANQNWLIRCDMDERLLNDGFNMGVSLDNADVPVMVFRSNLNVQGLVNIAPHESVHLAQIFNGDYVPGRGISTWKGIEKKNLAYDDPNYLSNQYQPWEYEAEKWAKKVRVDICRKHPEIETLMEK